MATEPGSGPMVRGTAFLGTIKHLKGRPNGERDLERIISTMPPDSASLFQRKIVAIMTYPYPVFIDFLKAVDKRLGRGDLLFCREIGKISARLDIQTVYEIYKKRARPEDLSRDSDVIWKSYYVNAGRMKTEDLTPDHTLVRIYDFPQMHPAHCRLMEGWMTQAVVEIGGIAIQEMREVKCMAKGDEYHEFTGSWKPADQN